MFGDMEIKKRKFCHCKNLIFLEYADTDNIKVSSMVSSVEKSYKYFIDYKDDDYKIKPLHIMLPKTSAYVKLYSGETKWVKFLINDDDLLEKCSSIWNIVSNSIKKELDYEPIYNNFFFENQNRVLQ